MLATSPSFCPSRARQISPEPPGWIRRSLLIHNYTRKHQITTDGAAPVTARVAVLNIKITRLMGGEISSPGRKLGVEPSQICEIIYIKTHNDSHSVRVHKAEGTF